MSATASRPVSVSVTAAAARGVPALVRDAEAGSFIVVERRHQPVAAIIGVQRLEVLEEAERDLRDIGLVLARAATDSGERTDLDEVITRLGFDRPTLEAELDGDLAAGIE